MLNKRAGVIVALLIAVVAAGAGTGAADVPGAGQLLSVRAEPIGSAPYPAGTHVYKMRYLSTTPQHHYTVVSGVTLVPPGKPPAGGWPVVGWDHGTTGIGDGCAPSLVDGGYYGPTLSTYLRHGYAIAATDYAGLGTAGIHPYLVTKSEAYATIDAVRAARQIQPGLSKTWFAAGHSQGGQAAWATAENARSYGAGLRFRGAVAYAPAPNMSNFIDAITESGQPVDQEFYEMMLIGLKTQHPQLRFDDYLGPDARALLPDSRKLCFDDLTARFAAAKLPASQFAVTGRVAYDRLQRWFGENEIGHVRAAGPLFVAQGTADPIVPPEQTAAEVVGAEQHGSTVDFHRYADADHGGVLNAASADVLAWLAAHRR